MKDPNALEHYKERFLDLGIDPKDYQLLLVFFLFAVGWADGDLQKQEASSILDILQEGNLFQVDANHPAIQKWSNTPITAEQLGQGHVLLSCLMDDGNGTFFSAAQLKEMLRLAQKVAKSTGGFLGLGKVSTTESVLLAYLKVQVVQFLVSLERNLDALGSKSS